MKRTILLIIAAVFSIASYAQNENDALRYSLINYGGTARFTALSGAYGAIGADFSSLSQNPAGIGLYRKSEFSITPLFASNKTESNYIGSQQSDARATLSMGNIGYIMAVKLNANNDNLLKQIQFGFGMNRIATFNNRMIVQGLNNNNSLMLQYLDKADASGSSPSNLDNFSTGLAYDVNLIYQDTNKVWQADLPFGRVNQHKSIETKGGIKETVLSAGGNFSEKLFLGITFGFPQINYTEESTYSENDINELSPYLKSFERSEYVNTKGSGLNFKFGFIYKPTDFVRIGGALHTPTYYSEMKDTYNAKMSSVFDKAPLENSSATRFNAKSPDGEYEYQLTTPMRASGSLAFIVKQFGLISADYEYVDYSTARLHADDYSFQSENNMLSTTLTSANNLRIGTEWKVGKIALRGGYSIYGSPYKGETMSGLGSRTGYSFGFGVHERSYFVDFSYNHISSKDNYYIYGYAPASQNTYNSNSYSFTLGFRM